MARDRHPAAPLPARLLTALGGRRGVRAPAATPGVAALAPVVALLALPVGLAALRQAACATTGWDGRTALWGQCASPLLAGTGTPDLPLLQRFAVGLLRAAAPGTGMPEHRWVLVLWTVAAALLLAALVVLVGTTRRHPLADPLPLALSPVVALAVLTSTGLVPVTCSVLAVAAWSRGRVAVAGALAGLGVLGGPLGLAPLLGLVLLSRRADVRRLLGGAGAAVVLVAGPAAALDPGLLARPVAAWWTDGAGPGSPWFVPSLVERPLPGTAAAGLAVLGMLLAAVLAGLLPRHRVRPPVADVVVLALVVALVTAPALPVGAALWLVPFLALAGVPWRDQLLWAGAEVVHAVALSAWLAAATDPAHGLPAGWYATTLALRLVALGRLGWVVWARATWGTGLPDPSPRTDWEPGRAAGRLERLPAGHPVDEPRGAVGDTAYPPVTERP